MIFETGDSVRIIKGLYKGFEGTFVSKHKDHDLLIIKPVNSGEDIVVREKFVEKIGHMDAGSSEDNKDIDTMNWLIHDSDNKFIASTKTESEAWTLVAKLLSETPWVFAPPLKIKKAEQNELVSLPLKLWAEAKFASEIRSVSFSKLVELSLTEYLK